MTDELHASETTWGSIALAVVVGFLVVAAGASYYFYREWREVRRELNRVREEAGQNPVQEVVDQVGKVYELPQGEKPQLVTIKSTDNLEKHPFLAKAQVGDKILIYAGAKMAVMYRPATHKVVAVGTVTIQEGAKNATPSASPPQ